MLELAAPPTELFPAEDFVIEKDDKGNFPIYRLAEDNDDHRFALYMSTSIGAKDVPHIFPWAVIVSVQGTKKRIGSTKKLATIPSRARGRSRQCGGTTVRPGVGVCHARGCAQYSSSQRAAGAHPAHVRAGLDHLPNRVTFNMAEGTCKVFPASPNIREAR